MAAVLLSVPFFSMDDFLVLDSVPRRYGGRAVVDGISLHIR